MEHESFADRVDAITVEELRAIGATKWSDPEVLGAFVAEMDFGVAPVITEALHAAVAEGAFGYTPPKFTAALKEATSAHLNAGGRWRTTPEQIVPVPDVLKAMELAIEHFTSPGSKVIVPTPAYMPFLLIPPMLGREVIEVPLTQAGERWQLDLAGIQRAFDDGAELLVLCNPYNPVGRVFTEAELTELSTLVERNGGRVFSDEIWESLVFSGSTLVPYATLNETAAGHTITATSASKSFNLPGLKCAVLVTSNPADQAKIASLGRFPSLGTATLGMVANTVAFEQAGDWLADALEYLEVTRDEMVDFVAEHLPGVRYIKPEGTYVAWLDFRETGIEDPAAFFREHAGVGLTDGRDCGEVGAGCARLIMATPRPILRDIVRRMGRAMASR